MIEPMKQRFKKKYRKSSSRELIFNDDIDSLGRDKRYYRNKYNDKKPKWRAKRREQRRSKRTKCINDDILKLLEKEVNRE